MSRMITRLIPELQPLREVNGVETYKADAEPTLCDCGELLPAVISPEDFAFHRKHFHALCGQCHCEPCVCPSCSECARFGVCSRHPEGL